MPVVRRQSKPGRYADASAQRVQRRQVAAPAEIDDATMDKMVRALSENDGTFINASGQADNLNGYNMAALDLAPNALNSSAVGSLMASASVGSLLAESAFNQSYADGGMIAGPGTGTSD